MWIMIMSLLLLLALAAVVYLVTRFHRFSFIKDLEKKSRLLSWLAALLPVAALGFFARINTVTLVIVLLHLTAGFLLCGFAAFLIRKTAKKEVSSNAVGAAAVLLTTVYLAAGWFAAHHVSETDYRLETEKPLPHPMRIVLLADSHLGITLDGAGFTREIDRVRALGPDAVVIAGDFVDDDSSAADMAEACRALGSLQGTCPVFYVYGNHDRGYYRYRNFEGGQLREELEKNGVIILEDESILLDDCLTVIGRKDRSDRSRADMETLLAGVDRETYTVVLDHQPNDYAAEAEAGVDLVLSGHTHGGHIFPGGLIGLLIGANDAVYGLSKRGETNFIVTSGISGWAIPFKTGCFSEFAVIDVLPSAS